MADNERHYHASTCVFIYGQKTHVALISAQSNFRFRCYPTPELSSAVLKSTYRPTV